ncbi:uncharacterized protein si:ch211-271e10.2 [Hoplias malabaricus]|uniref:uncharacterized protein si:ch211-271e10.2 n=1 Tax=Hoplias malabaricus TaxID=27720 RepID=UPI0034625E83
MEVDGSGNDQAHRGDDEAIGYYVPGPPVYFDFLNFFHENLNLKKVNTVEECHFIVAFCQCLSQSKRNTENALQNLPSDADKPVLQVMLYQTSDLDYSWVPDSCGTVVRNHIFTVGFLISEDKKLLQSWRNDVSLARIKVWIDKIKVKKPEIKCQSSCPITETLRPLCKYLTIKTGETLNCYSEIKTVLHKRRPELQEVTELDKCDVIFVFSPDTIAALNVLPALKPVVLFELQQLSENNKTFHGSKRYVFRENIFRVDCLLSDNTGLEKCEQNDEELLRVADWLIPERSRQQKSTVGGERGSYDMVLHPTSNPSSSRSVSNNNMLTVDCLCSNDKKLQKCHQNTEALLKVANWLMPEESEDGPNQGKRPMLRETKPVKIFSYVSGKTLGSHDNFIRTLKQRTNVQEVFRVEECDVILFFSPIVSRAGTDMEAALKKFDDTFGVTKPAVMVVLHHTIDPNRIVADSSKSVSRENTLTVDCLFHEDKGLLQCTKNTETLSTVSKWIKTKADLKIRSGSQTNEMTQFSKTNKCNDQDYCINAKKYLNKYFTVSLGNIQRLNEDIKTALYKQRSQLQEVSTAEECDVILVFSTFVSQAQTDIKTTLKGLLCIPDLRPVVWIVFHNISDQKMKIPDRNRSVTAENIVDCLYNKERGILQCIRNYGAMCIKCQVENGLIPKESEDGPNQGKRPMLRETKPVKIFSYVSGKTLGSHDNFIRTLKQRTNVQEVFRVEECDVILFFSPIVSRAGTDMEAALKKFDDTFGVTKPAVMVVLHHTIDPNRIVADSSKSVSRENTLTVDCLFHEDKGLLQCTKNTETLSTVSKWIEKKQVATKTSSADQLKNKFANSIHSTTAWLYHRSNLMLEI